MATVSRISWEDAQKAAKRAPARGFMGSASAIEIVLPDIAGTIDDIRSFAAAPHWLRYEYNRARGEAFAYGGEERRRKAERLLDEVFLAVSGETCPECSRPGNYMNLTREGSAWSCEEHGGFQVIPMEDDDV